MHSEFHTRRPLLLYAGMALFVTAGVAWTQSPEFEVDKLLASDGAAGDEFGYATATSGGLIAVGARRDDASGADSGAAYLFDASTGVQLHELLPTDGAPGDQFGFAIAVSGGRVVVGAPLDDDQGSSSGAAYVFDAASGAQLAKLVASDGAAGDEFGTTVAMDGNLVAVGAPRDDDNGTDSGSIYLFDAVSGLPIDKLLSDDGTGGELLGSALDMDAGTVAAGARLDDQNGFQSGSAYLFDAAAGTQLHKLLPTDPFTNGTVDFFGAAIAIDDGIVAVGAWADSIFFDHSGSAYLFDAATGTQMMKLVPADGHDRDHFGISVAVDSGVVVIGADGDDDSAVNAGSAYLYDATDGSLVVKLLASDGASFDEFGTAVAIDGNRVVIGAHRDDDDGPSSGSVYVYGEPSAPNPLRFCSPGQANETGAPSALEALGSMSVAANDLTFQVSPLAPGNNGLVAYSPDQTSVPLGNGTLCLGNETLGYVLRLPAGAPDASGVLSFSLDNTATPNPGIGDITVGSTWNFQAWHRDFTPGGAGFNFSDALQITFEP